MPEDICSELIKITMKLDVAAIDRVMEALNNIRQQKEAGNSGKENRLLLLFIIDMIARREAILKKTKQELDTLRQDRLAAQVLRSITFAFSFSLRNFLFFGFSFRHSVVISQGLMSFAVQVHQGEQQIPLV